MGEAVVPEVSATAVSVDAMLAVEHLAVSFGSGRTRVEVVRDVSYEVRRGEIVGIVGESGSGKTVSSLACLGLLPALGGHLERGTITFDGRDVTTASESEWRKLRGNRIGMIFQQPTRSLDPAFTVGDQIAEAVRLNVGLGRKASWARAVEMLDLVHIPDAARRARQHPHTFSGGMCQRVMIAMALACEPDLLIADEPTTALDVTVQAKILGLLREIQRESGIAIVYITHDMGVVAQLCDRVAVLYAGEIVEMAGVEALFDRPQHPFTEGLLRSIPRAGSGVRMRSIPGQVPSPDDMPLGCRFHPRCSYADPDRCAKSDPGLTILGTNSSVRCVRHAELELFGIA